MQTHRVLILAVAASAVVLSACGQQSGEATDDLAAAGAASVSGTTTAAPAAPAVRAVEVGDRFSGPGTFRVGRGLTGAPIAIPAGRYRLYFGTDLATGADYTAGTWMRCSELPCEPGASDSAVASGVVGVDRRTGEPRSQSLAADGTLVEHGTTLVVEPGDGALYLHGLSIQLLGFS